LVVFLLTTFQLVVLQVLACVDDIFHDAMDQQPWYVYLIRYGYRFDTFTGFFNALVWGLNRSCVVTLIDCCFPSTTDRDTGCNGMLTTPLVIDTLKDESYNQSSCRNGQPTGTGSENSGSVCQRGDNNTSSSISSAGGRSYHHDDEPTWDCIPLGHLHISTETDTDNSTHLGKRPNTNSNVLGKGGFGVVFKGMYQGNRVAVKRVSWTFWETMMRKKPPTASDGSSGRGGSSGSSGSNDTNQAVGTGTKLFPLGSTSSGHGSTIQVARELLAEAAILSKLRHPNIVSWPSHLFLQCHQPIGTRQSAQHSFCCVCVCVCVCVCACVRAFVCVCICV
jgi:hypothetical protein